MQVLLSVPERRRIHGNPTSCVSFVFHFGTTISERRRFFSLARVKLDQTVQKGKGTFEVSFDTWTLGCGEAENAVVEMMI